MSLSTRWYGKTNYPESLELMSQRADNAYKNHAIEVMGFEYPCTITLGLRASREEQRPRTDGVPVVSVGRGGLATLHNEGQTVIYPIVPLKYYGLFAKEWVDLLTQTTANTLSLCNIMVESTNSGVFTKNGKIASVGISLKRGVSTHGIAVNVSNSLEDFGKIIPCGIVGQPFDKVENYRSITTEGFFGIWTQEFKRSFSPYMSRSLTNTHANP